jgi:hypothetical protein
MRSVEVFNLLVLLLLSLPFALIYIKRKKLGHRLDSISSNLSEDDSLVYPEEVLNSASGLEPHWTARLKKPNMGGSMPRGKKGKKIAVTFMALVALAVPMLTMQPKAHAISQYAPECAPSYLAKWDLPAQLKAIQPTYENGTSPLFIYKENSAGTRNIFKVAVGKTPTSHFTMNFEESTLKAQLLTNDGFYLYTMFDEPTGAAYGYDSFWSGQNDTQRLKVDVATQFTFNGTSSYIPDMGNASCFTNFMGDVSYSNTWRARDFDVIQKNLPYASVDGQKSCEIIDLACQIGKVFIPNSAKNKTQFDNLAAFLNSKLGFLTYPITFIANLFEAFHSSSAWCSSSSCTKNFGSFMGGNFTLDLNQPLHTMPTLWAWFLGLLRGITVLTLLLAIRKKYMGIVSK